MHGVNNHRRESPAADCDIRPPGTCVWSIARSSAAKHGVSGMDDEAILEAIRAHPAEAAEALVAIQVGLGDDKPLTAASIAAAAKLLGDDPAELWVDRLQQAGLV